MRSWMLATAAGIAAAGWLPVLPPVCFLPVVLAGLLGVAWIGWRASVSEKPRKHSFFITKPSVNCYFLMFVLGMAWGIQDGQRSLNAWLPPALEGVDFWLYGVVDSLPQRNGRAMQFELAVTGQCFELHPSGCTVGQRYLPLRRVMLNHYGDEALEPGQHWRLRVRLNRPHGLANPGGFDYELMLVQRGIDGRGYVRPTRFNEQLETRFTYQRLRFQLLQRLQAETADMPRRGLLHALALGERSEIPDAHWNLFTETGTNHLVVISGLHVGFVATVCYWLLNLLARLFPCLLRRLPAQKCGALGAILGAAVYALLAGFSLPTQRALVMVAVFMSGRLLAREYPLSLGYISALLLVLVLEPLSAMSAGFWLSFVAVGALLLACSCRITHRDHFEEDEPGFGVRLGRRLWRGLHWRVWVRPQWVVFVGMSLPLILWLQQLSLASPLANIIAIPLVSLLVVPLCLSGLLMLYLYSPWGGAMLLAADWLLGLLLAVLEALVDYLSVELLQFAGLRMVVYPFAALGTLLLLLPRGWPGRYLAPVLLLPLLIPQPMPSPAPGEAWVTVLDVGQGLSVLVQTAEHSLLYDAGPGFVDGFDAGRSVVAPMLRRQGISVLDRVIISHGDADHAGGLNGLMETTGVETLLLGTALQRAPPGANPEDCERGQRWRWDGVDFEVLHPGRRPYRQRNDNSCVLRVTTVSHSLLLPGDIEVAEAELLESAANLRSDVLVAPHHGSDSSSSAAFVAAVKPQIVIFATGYRNQFGHPDPEVVARYRAAGAQTFDTATTGALWLRLPRTGEPGLDPAPPAAWRQVRRRYWSAP